MEDLIPVNWKIFRRHVELLEFYHDNNQSEAARKAFDELIQFRNTSSLSKVVTTYINIVNLLLMFVILSILLLMML